MPLIAVAIRGLAVAPCASRPRVAVPAAPRRIRWLVGAGSIRAPLLAADTEMALGPCPRSRACRASIRHSDEMMPSRRTCTRVHELSVLIRSDGRCPFSP